MTASGSDLTLLDVIDAVFEVADSNDEALAVVNYLLCTGRIRFSPIGKFDKCALAQSHL